MKTKEEIQKRMDDSHAEFINQLNLSDEEIGSYGAIIQRAFNCGYTSGVLEAMEDFIL